MPQNIIYRLNASAILLECDKTNLILSRAEVMVGGTPQFLLNWKSLNAALTGVQRFLSHLFSSRVARPLNTNI